MITVYSDLGKNEYDIHSLTKAFYPHEDVRISEKEQEEEDKSLVYCFENGDKLSFAVPGNDRDELKRTIYRKLSQRTGKELPWGSLTGIRPVKMAMDRFRRGLSRDEVIKDMTTQYYVNQNKAELCADIAVNEMEILSGIKKEDFSLYVDIPFCPTTCLYCSFTSNRVGKDRGPVRDYLKALFYEIRKTGDLFKDRKPDSVYIGGGTPTTLTPRELEELFECLEESFDTAGAREFTVEAGRPDTIDRERLRVIKKHGVSRICINPQTMNEKTLRVIGRSHTPKEVISAFYLAREEGFDNINMDMIIGLPGEGEDEVKNTMRELKRLSPDNLTIHTLAIKRASALGDRELGELRKRLPLTDRMMEISVSGAYEMGMEPYYLYRQKNMSGNLENTGFAGKGKYGCYNILINEEVQDILALGAGAISKKVNEKGDCERSANFKLADQYIANVDKMIGRKEKLFFS